MKRIIIENKHRKQQIIDDISDVNISGDYLIVTLKKQVDNDNELELIKRSHVFNLNDIKQYEIIIPTRRISDEYND